MTYLRHVARLTPGALEVFAAHRAYDVLVALHTVPEMVIPVDKVEVAGPAKVVLGRVGLVLAQGGASLEDGAAATEGAGEGLRGAAGGGHVDRAAMTWAGERD